MIAWLFDCCCGPNNNILSNRNNNLFMDRGNMLIIVSVVLVLEIELSVSDRQT